MNRYLSAIPLGLGVVLCACPGEGTGPGRNQAYCDTVSTVSFACDVQPIFSANCAQPGCHVSPNPQEGMNLGEGQAYGSIVGVPSGEVPALQRVQPGFPDSSYLVHKIQGTHLSVGGSGDRMPAGSAPLAQSQIDIIRAWIEAGALDN